MRRILFLLFLFFFSFFSFAGFSPETVVLGPQKSLPIEQLQKDSCVTSCDLTRSTIVQGAVSNQRTYTSSLTCKVICDDDISFVASPNQRVIINDEWCFVRDLKKGDRLKCCDVSRRCGSTEADGSYVIVLSVEACNDEQLLCEITVEPYHTLCVTSRGIIAHNHPVAIFAVAPPIVSVLSKIAIVGVISGALWSLFGNKKSRDKNHFIQEALSTGSSSSPPPKKPNHEDEFRKKHPHGRYEDAGYHKNHQSGRKSPRPINGQEALDNSHLIEGQNRHRISVNNQEVVVLYETSPGLYHGHVRTWSDLTNGMRNTLIHRGLMSTKGKLLK